MTAHADQPDQPDQPEQQQPDSGQLLDAIANGLMLPLQVQRLHLAGLTPADNPDLLAPQVLFALEGIPLYAPTQMRTYVTYLDLDTARAMPGAVAAAIAEAEEGQSGLVAANPADVATVAAQAARAEQLRGSGRS